MMILPHFLDRFGVGGDLQALSVFFPPLGSPPVHVQGAGLSRLGLVSPEWQGPPLRLFLLSFDLLVFLCARCSGGRRTLRCANLLSPRSVARSAPSPLAEPK